MTRRLVVTRPEPGASRTARRLAELGFVPLVLPLTRTLSLDTSGEPAEAASVAITSASALRHAPKDLIARHAGLPCFAVGASTAEAARDAGFGTVSEGPGDAAGLARLLVGEAPQPVLYLCGRVRRPNFEALLAAAGMRIHVVETYDTQRIEPDADLVRTIVGDRPPDGVLLQSVEAALAFEALLRRAELAPLFSDATLFCLSPRVAEALDKSHAAKLIVAMQPTEQALLSSLSDSA